MKLRIPCAAENRFGPTRSEEAKLKHGFPGFYRGARYFQIECTPAPGSSELPVIESLEGVVVHTSSAQVGEFSCSNDLFNRIYTLVGWA